MHEEHLSKQTYENLMKAVDAAAKEVLANTGGVVVLLDIRAGYTKFGGGQVGMGMQVIGCNKHEHDRRPAPEKTAPYTEAKDLVEEVLRRLKPKDPRGN